MTSKNYAGDTFPSHWDDQLRQTMQERYKAIPEEFYTRSGRKPITPANVTAWVKASSGKGLRWQFWELCAGSGRLSLVLMTASMVVGFPVDYRYGWDLSYPQHQELLRQCYQEFRPAHVFGAPTCTPWTNASNSKDRERRQMERDRELPTLEFINEIMLYQHNSQRGFSLEQPYGSDMLTASPISRLREIAGVRVWRTDQCMLGARDEKNQPVRKSTAILSNRNWKHVIKRCDNHRGAHMEFFKVKFVVSIGPPRQLSIRSGFASCMVKTYGPFCARTRPWVEGLGPLSSCGLTPCTTPVSVASWDVPHRRESSTT